MPDASTKTTTEAVFERVTVAGEDLLKRSRRLSPRGMSGGSPLKTKMAGRLWNCR